LKSPQILPQPEKKESFLKRAFKKVVRLPKLKVKEIPSEKEPKIEKEITSELKNRPISPPLPVKKYQPPPIDLLETEKGQPVSGDIRQNSLIIQKTLESFGIPVEMAQVNVGPTVTQYTLKPADGIKLSKITTLANDLALALAAHPIRIEAPIPGKSLVGIEVPNKVRSLVRLRELIANPQFQNSPSHLTFCLGRDVSGNPTYADLARMPHLLVSGSTGTGKTIFLNSLILSLLYRNSPEILRFVLIDPKRVEFLVYQEIPHLAYPVIFDVQKTIDILKKVILEMEKRFEILSEKKCRDILSFNELAQKEEKELMPYIVLIIDELADLMAARGREIEASIVRIAQLARAVGIHLVVATQRPSVEVITGLIKANITSRITFQVASQVDSRTVLDMAGAEKLLGRGDLLFLSAENPKPKRIQACYVSEKELKKVVNWLKANVPQKEFLWEILNQEILPEIAEEKEWLFDQEDPLYEEAKKIVIEAKKASASLLQRKLKIGYARAARLLDILEERGVVGPAQGAKPREVYFKSEEEENGQWQKI
jgi:S-DNA-T family DNA segregation ATPase FtsK/SpoIIIE